MNCKQLIPEFVVKDVERSIVFYENNLNFRLVEKSPKAGTPIWAEMENGAVRVMFQRKLEVLSEIPLLKERAIGGTMIVVLRMDTYKSVQVLWEKLKDTQFIVTPIHKTDYGTEEFAIQDQDSYILLIAG